jgi:riboflavin kinase/FMN adenylyltransferase
MPQRRSILSVGNFDGVHRGHQALLRRARQLAIKQGPGTRVVALAFPHHPLSVLRPAAAPSPLTDTPQREKLLLEAGADAVQWLAPLDGILPLTAEQFIDRVVAEHRPAAWLEGPDFHFGKGRGGDMAMLRRVGAERGFEAIEISPVEVVLRDKTTVPVRSSLVRWLVSMGRVVDAQLCLGRPFALRGKVVVGEKRGRAIGFPTANMDTGPLQLPADGVYAGSVELDGREFLAAISVGTKPTFQDAQRTVETYLLDYSGDLYGRTIEVRFSRWLREQWALPSLEILIAQIQRDVDHVRQLADDGALAVGPLAGV